MTKKRTSQKKITKRTSTKPKRAPNRSVLLAEEKERLGHPVGELLFVGTANVAKYWWCAQESVLKCLEREQDFFDVYVSDRIRAAVALGYLKATPDTITPDHLALLDAVNAQEIEASLMKKKPSIGIASATSKNVVFFSPALPDDEREFLEELAVAEGKTIGRLEDAPPILRGRLMEATSERHPSFRWHWKYGGFIFIGEPDGMNRTTIYEFKTCRNEFISKFTKPVAETQADMYGTFLTRSQKHVEIHLMDTKSSLRFDTPIRMDRVEETVAKFRAVLKGARPPIPRQWKCNNCDYHPIPCPLFVT